MPFLRVPFPLGLDVVQRLIDQLGCYLAVRELPFVADCLADLTAQTLDRVGRVGDLPQLGRERKN